MDKGSYLVFAQEFAQGSKKLSVSRTEEHGKNEDLVSGIREPFGPGQAQDAGDNVDSQCCGEPEVI